MVARSSARTIALLAGAGGCGRTSTAIALARHLAERGNKTIIFDLCFGWGGLGLNVSNAVSYAALLDKDDDIDEAVYISEFGFDILTCLPPSVLDPSLEDFKKITWLTQKLCDKYDFLILDPPSGGHPLSLLAAGLSENILLFSRADGASVASSYCLLKSLRAEGIASRTGAIFSFVESSEQAASLKTRLDILTGQFLGLKLQDHGFISRLEPDSDGEVEIGERGSFEMIRHLSINDIAPLQNGTRRESAGIEFPDTVKAGR
jgi:MinD-like ATPase involved in chromosome partitioning or flagellar assembly